MRENLHECVQAGRENNEPSGVGEEKLRRRTPITVVGKGWKPPLLSADKENIYSFISNHPDLEESDPFRYKDQGSIPKVGQR